jgi:hypothetical protein
MCSPFELLLTHTKKADRDYSLDQVTDGHSDQYSQTVKRLNYSHSEPNRSITNKMRANPVPNI